jgi:D-tyrosyl-tRNA(Tyr) deacylase
VARTAPGGRRRQAARARGLGPVRALLQRVSRAEVRVADERVGAIGRGLLVLLGVAPGDDEATADTLARRIVELRIHEDAEGRTNLALGEVGGAVLAVSQFTLYADTRRGRRPGFTGAAPPEHAEALYRRFCRALEATGTHVERGRFGASMAVELVNDGPFTIWLDSADR